MRRGLPATPIWSRIEGKGGSVMSEDLSVFDPLISRLRQAVALGGDARIAAAVKAEIEAFIAGQGPDDLRLPERFYQKDPCGKYGRRPLVAEDGLNVLVMTWE